jgi:hypothetical protein
MEKRTLSNNPLCNVPFSIFIYTDEGNVERLAKITSVAN